MTVAVSLNEVQAKLDAAPADSVEAETLRLYLDWLTLSRDADALVDTTTCRQDNIQGFIRWECCEPHRALTTRDGSVRARAADLQARSGKSFPNGSPMSQVWWQTLGIDHPLLPTVVD
jgi:hypothetical protein